MRLQKFMADAGVASRRKCEQIILEGRVQVNGKPAVLGMGVLPGDEVRLDGKCLSLQAGRVVLAFNKPRGVVCTANDPEGRKSVADYFKNLPHRVHNIGRLDYDSEGLLLMTNDGQLTYRLTHPSYMVKKTYLVKCTGQVDEADRRWLEQGVELEDGVTAPAKVKILEKTAGTTTLEITIHEGRNRQVRRMLQALGHEIKMLRRIRMATVELGELQAGHWRQLSGAELKELDEAVGVCSKPANNKKTLQRPAGKAGKTQK